jgi:hypothetical protein
MTTRRTFLIAGVGAFAVPLTACGGGDSESTDLADPATTPPQAPPIPPPPPEPPPPGPEPPSTASPPGYEDPIVIYDGKLGITGTNLYATLLPWKNPLGDWFDALGVAQGTKPFGQATVATNQTAPVTINVTSLVTLGGEPSLVLRVPASGAFAPMLVFRSRESGSGPRLAVTYTDGTTGSIPVMYDADCNLSTAYELGSRPTLTLTPSGSNVYLRFPKPAKTVASATLVLQVDRIPQGGQIAVYRFALHRDPVPADRFTLKGDPRVFLETESFEDAPFYLRAQIFGDVPHSYLIDTYHQRAAVDVEGGGRALQVTFDPRVNAALTASVCFPNFDEANEAAWEFDIRLMPDMLGGLQDGIKCFAGCSSSTKNDDAYFATWSGTRTPGRCGTLLAGNGGAKAHGYDGWSMRWDAWNSPPAPHPLHGRFMPMQYVYWPEQIDFYGDPWSWRLNRASLQAGQWYTITQRAKVNSCVGTDWEPDAELDGYIDHVPALRRRGFYLRTTDTPLIAKPPYNVRSKLAIGRIWLNTYHGGTSLPLARCSLQVRNFRAAKFA